MIRAQTLLRVHGATRLAPILVLIAFLHVGQITAADEEYALALWSRGASTVFIIGPVLAAGAAWEASRLREAAVLQMPTVVAKGWVVANALIPLIAAGVIASAAAFVASAGLTIPSLPIMAVVLGIVVSHVLAGFALGSWIRPIVAVPAALTLLYAWMVVPPTVEPLWVRHLTGRWASCCTLSTELSSAAVWASVAISLGIIATASMSLWSLRRKAIMALVPLPLILAIFVSVPLVKDLGPDPAVARDDQLVCGQEQGIRVCLWPEHEKQLNDTLAAASAAVTAWEAADLSTPTEFSEQPADRSFGISSGMDRDAVLNALSFSLLPAIPACASTQAYPGGAAEPYVQLWLSSLAGVDNAQVLGFDRDIARVVRRVQSWDERRQLEWYELNIRALKDCGMPPTQDIATS